MAIIQMQKIRLLTHSGVAPEVLDCVQKTGLVELTEVSNDCLLAQEKSVFEFNYVTARLEFAVNFLSKYKEKKSKMKSLLEGDDIIVKEADFESILHSFSFNDTVDESATLQEEVNMAMNKVTSLQEEFELLLDWRAFPASLGSFETDFTKTIFIEKACEKKIQKNEQHKRLEDSLKEKDVAILTVNISPEKLALVFLKEHENIVNEFVKKYEYTTVSLPQRRGSPEEELDRIKRAIVKAELHKNESEQKTREFAVENLKKLKILSDYISWKKEKHNVVVSAPKLSSVLVFEGWCPKNKVALLNERVSAVNSLSDISEIDPSDGEEPPVEIENGKIIAPFESITRLYGLPGHKDLDPTIFLAGFFFLFFGLSLTDVGYGVFLVAITGGALLFFKLPKSVKPLIRLLMLGGIASVLVGALFGGYLGIAIDSFPAWMQAVAKFDPIANPLPVFYMALGLGVVQIMFGIILRIVSEARNNNLVGGILDHGVWLLLFVAFMLFGAEKIGYIESSMTPVLWTAFALLVASGARHGKTVGQMIMKGLIKLYDIIGYFSDVLSYSRLLALGLATSALAFAVNLIAEIIGDMIPVIGPAVAIVVLIVGHLFNLAVNTLGAFIHSARLQFVEFFGKFITGTGRIFRPFKRSARYVAVVDSIDSG